MGNLEQFDRAAGHYDTPERIRIAGITADAIRSHLKKTKDRTAIDFGCGTGLVGLELASEFRSMLLLDASRRMVEIAEQKIARLKIPNAQALCLDLEAADHPELEADYILAVNVLIHIKDYRTVLARLYEWMRPGGHLLIADFDRNDRITSDLVHPGFDQEGLKTMLCEIGFQAVSSRKVYSGTRLFMDQDASLFLMDARK